MTCCIRPTWARCLYLKTWLTSIEVRVKTYWTRRPFQRRRHCNNIIKTSNKTLKQSSTNGKMKSSRTQIETSKSVSRRATERLSSTCRSSWVTRRDTSKAKCSFLICTARITRLARKSWSRNIPETTNRTQISRTPALLARCLLEIKVWDPSHLLWSPTDHVCRSRSQPIRSQ